MKLALGTVQFGLNYGIANNHGQVSFKEAPKIIQYAKQSGIDTLDTAIAYGDSEYRLGKIGIQDWKVVTKLPAIPSGCNDISKWINEAVSTSLERLKLNSLYGILLHWPQQLLDNDGVKIYLALKQVKEAGLTQKIGISIYDPKELDKFCSKHHFDIIQAPFNILDNRLINSGWIYHLADMETELHVRSIFLQGLLLMKPNERPNKFNRWSSIWSIYDDWLTQTKITSLQACLRYALSFPEISKVIIGVDSLNQLMDILKEAKGPAPEISELFKTHDSDLLNPSNWPTFN